MGARGPVRAVLTGDAKHGGPMRLIRSTAVGLAVLAGMSGGRAEAYPQMGQVSITPGLGAALVANQDIKDYYGPGLTANSSPVAASIGAGIDYNVSDSFQL